MGGLRNFGRFMVAERFLDEGVETDQPSPETYAPDDPARISGRKSGMWPMNLSLDKATTVDYPAVTGPLHDQMVDSWAESVRRSLLRRMATEPVRRFRHLSGGRLFRQYREFGQPELVGLRQWIVQEAGEAGRRVAV